MNFFEFDSSHEVCGLGAARSAAGCSCAGTPAAPVSLACSSVRERGFTLVELMVVVIIIGVLAAFAVPSFQDMIQRGQATNAMHEVLANLKLARSEAARRGQNVSLFLNTTDRSIKMVVGDDPSVTDDRLVQASNISGKIDMRRGPGGAAADPFTGTVADSIKFMPRGNVTQQVKIYFTHESNPDRIKRCLSVNLGGMVKTFQDAEADTCGG